MPGASRKQAFAGYASRRHDTQDKQHLPPDDTDDGDFADVSVLGHAAADPRFAMAAVHIVSGVLVAIASFVLGRSASFGLATVNQICIGVVFSHGCETEKECWPKQKLSRILLIAGHFSLCTGVLFGLHQTVIANGPLSRSKTYSIAVVFILIAAVFHLSTIGYLLTQVSFDNVAVGSAVSILPALLEIAIAIYIQKSRCTGGQRNHDKKGLVSRSQESVARKIFDIELVGRSARLNRFF